MTTFIYAALVIVPVIALGYIVYSSMKNHANGMNGRKVLARNLISFGLVLAVCSVMAFSVSAVESASEPDDAAVVLAAAEEDGAAEEAKHSDGGLATGLGYLAAGLVTSLAGIGGGIAVAAGAPAAIAATSEDPKSFGKSLIFVALGESIALYGVVISILIINKL